MRSSPGVRYPSRVIPAAYSSARKRIGINKIDGSDNDYAVKLTGDGLMIGDGSITFISITKDGILMNDGETDRILLGKDEGGF